MCGWWCHGAIGADSGRVVAEYARVTNVGPVDAAAVPRFAAPATFARLPELCTVREADVAVLGVPFDGGTSYRPGARFGPQAVRAASKLLRPYHPGHDTEPFDVQQVVDAGDVACTPFNIESAVNAIEQTARTLQERVGRIVAIGGDHTIALPLLRALASRHGPVALVHFDAHLDTWDTYFDAPITHGTPFRRAREEGLLLDGHSMHVGIRGSLYSRDDLPEDEVMGFRTISCVDLDSLGIAGVGEAIVTRVSSAPLYISIDIDVLDPAHAPGTGTPEAGGLTSRELLGILSRMSETNIVGADVVEVSPPYDHAEVTSLVAATLVYELVALIAKSPSRDSASTGHADAPARSSFS
jgi:agmatinase